MDVSVNVYYGKAQEVSIDKNTRGYELYLLEGDCETSVIFDSVAQMNELAVSMLKQVALLEIEAERKRREK